MSGYLRDRWLWLGLGAAFLIGTYIVHITTPENTQEEVEMKDDLPPEIAHPIPERLSLKTLRTLIDSPNPNIRQMAIDLVLKRMQHLDLNAQVVSSIKTDAQSSDEDTRLKANTTLKFLQLDNDIPFVRSPTWSEASSSSPHWTDEPDAYIVPSAQAPVAGWTAIPRERPAAGDSAVRRRRREAVVLHEGTGEVSEDDIIRPSDMHN